MSPDILPGLSAGASAPPPQTGPAATGPPGNTGLSALFASLLAKSSGPEPKGGAIPGLLAKQTVSASPSKFTLPIKAAPTKTAPTKIAPTKTAKLDPTKPDQMKPLPPPTAGVTAETQNAMDTVPVSGPRKAKASETKPGGELPLPEARTIPFVASPAPPVLFIALTPVLAAATPQVVKQSEPVAVALAAPVSLPSVVPTLPPVQALPMPAGLPPVVPPIMAVPTASPASPKAFTLSAAAPQPAAVVSAALKAMAAAQPETTAVRPYVVTVPALTVPALTTPAQAAAAVEPAPLVKAGSAPVLPRPKAEKALAVSPPAPKATDVAARAPLSLNAPRPTLSVPAPVRISAATATPQAVVMAAVPIRQIAPAVGDVPPDDNGKADVSPSAEVIPQAPATKISLKSLTPSADNNTRTQTPAASRPGPLSLKPQGVGEGFERPVTKAGDATHRVQEAATLVPAQASAAPMQTVSMTPAPLTRPDRAEVIRQVADAVGTMPPPTRPGASSQMTLQLHPRDWGQLQISIRLVPSGPGSVTQAQTVTAHVVAASPQIKAVLENGSGDLRHALRQAGLHLDKLTVMLQAPEAGAKSGMASGGHHLMNGGNGGQSQADARPSGNGPQPGGASFASFTGSPPGGRQDGQQAPAQAAPYNAGVQIEEPAAERDTPRRAVPGQVDMRA